jgi:GAF domain-containing protein
VTERLWRASDLQSGLDEVLAATIDLLGADMGCIRIAESDPLSLRIVAQRGLSDEYLREFDKVSVGDGTPTARAYQDRRGVTIKDVETNLTVALNPNNLRAAGCRAVHSTPLFGWGGTLIGVLSTHFREPPPAIRDGTALARFVRASYDRFY